MLIFMEFSFFFEMVSTTKKTKNKNIKLFAFSVHRKKKINTEKNKQIARKMYKDSGETNIIFLLCFICVCVCLFVLRKKKPKKPENKILTLTDRVTYFYDHCCFVFFSCKILKLFFFFFFWSWLHIWLLLLFSAPLSKDFVFLHNNNNNNIQIPEKKIKLQGNQSIQWNKQTNKKCSSYSHPK